jgi:hypothetical protein
MGTCHPVPGLRPRARRLSGEVALRSGLARSAFAAAAEARGLAGFIAASESSTRMAMNGKKLVGSGAAEPRKSILEGEAGRRGRSGDCQPRASAQVLPASHCS